MKKLLIFLGILLLVGTVSAVTWTNATGCWTATDGAYNLTMWNATGTNTWVLPGGVTSLDVLVVAGGGGGGRGAGGGGGAGGYNYTESFPAIGTITIVVGAGGKSSNATTYRGYTGGNSSFGSIDMYGGGGGGSVSEINGGVGGSGGGGVGGGANGMGGLGTSGQGYNGGDNFNSAPNFPGGGGGGSSVVGQTAPSGSVAGKGGNGTWCNITGTNTTYAGGGGGGTYNTGTAGIGGTGGGGAGANTNAVATNGTLNLGGGGGGGWRDNTGTINPLGGAGGSGVVIIRYTPGAAEKPILSFSANSTGGVQPLSVQFNDTSITTPTAWNWSYTNVTPGNNTPVYWSTIQNATQTFGNGHWHINLNVTNASGYNDTLLNYPLDVTPPTLTANFTGTPLGGTPGTAVTFTDNTTGSGISAWTYNWSFGDGVVNTTANPVHTYSANGVYDVNLTVYNASAGYSTKLRSGYITISDSGGLSGWNRQDILMDQIYTLTLRIKDTSTHNGIPSAIIQLSTGDNTTTDLFGVATFSMNYSAVVVSVGATGYYSRTISYVVDRDRTETIYLTEVAESPTPNSQSNLNLLYPHEVRIIAIDSNGGRLSNVVVSTVMLNTTTYGTNWWQYLYGISASATPMENTTMYGNTDAYGSIVFPMISSSLYRISFSQPSTGVSKTLDLYPDQMAYTFVLATTATAAIANSADYINQTLTVLEASPLIYLNMTYSDSGHTTSDITFYVKYANQTPANTQTFPSVAGSNQTVNTSYAVTNIKGDAYVWGFAANNTRFGWINNSQGITLKGASGVLYNPFIYKGEW